MTIIAIRSLTLSCALFRNYHLVTLKLKKSRKIQEKLGVPVENYFRDD